MFLSPSPTPTARWMCIPKPPLKSATASSPSWIGSIFCCARWGSKPTTGSDFGPTAAFSRTSPSPGRPAKPSPMAFPRAQLSLATPGSKAAATPQPGVAWLRQASIHAGTIAGLVPGNTYSIPVSVNVLPGYSLSGLQFRATLVPNGNAPAPGQIQFSAAPGLPAPYASTQGLSPNDIIYAWSLFAAFHARPPGQQCARLDFLPSPPRRAKRTILHLAVFGRGRVARPGHDLSIGKRAGHGLGGFRRARAAANHLRRMADVLLRQPDQRPGAG